MATNDVPVTGGAQALMGILQALGGTKSTSSSSMDTTALQGILQQLQGQDYSKVLEGIFQQASTQIPRLQAAYGNASGARSGSNSSVQAALEKLLSSTTTAATGELSRLQLQNSGQQAQVAQAIAQGRQKQTQTVAPNTSQAAKVLGTLQAISKIAPILKKGTKGLFGGDEAGTGFSYNPGVSFGGGGSTPGVGLTGPQLGFGSGESIGVPSLADSFGSGGASFPDLGGISFGDGQGFDLGGLDLAGAIGGYDPFQGINFGSSLDVGGFGNQFDFSAPDFSSFLGDSSGTGTGLSELISGGSDFFKESQPYLGALNYVANPEKIGSALKLGEGNFFGDVSQLAGLGSAIGSAGTALGISGAGSLAALGPIGLVAGLASVIGGHLTGAGKPTYEQYRAIGAKNLLVDNPDASNIEKSNYLYQYGSGEDNPYAKYFDAGARSYLDQVDAISSKGGGGNYFDLLTAESSAADREAAYRLDSSSGAPYTYGSYLNAGTEGFTPEYMTYEG